MSALRLGVPLLQDYAYLAARLRPDEIAQVLAMSGNLHYDPDLAAREFATIPGEAFVLVDDDNRPVLIGGFMPLRPGVFEGWMVGTVDGWAQHWRAITKTSRRLLDSLMADGAHRVQVTALASRTCAHDWYVRGLRMDQSPVCIVGYCASGDDAIMFARLKEPSNG